MVAPRSRLYLIDGSSYIFRAFFALPPMSNSNELPTQAIYGFTTMILKFLKEFQPEFLAVVFDKGRDTFRNEIYHEYKSNRPEAPADLIPQFPYTRKVLQAMNIPALELEGFEADDLIATLAKNFTSQETEVVIVSGDKDLMQLVGDTTRILDTMKSRWIGVEEVKEKFGVEPHQVVEVMGLMGDPVDNIPGIKGIGEKTAIPLIQKFQSLENLFDHLDDLNKVGIKSSTRVRKALMEGKEDALMSRKLATVRTDVPIHVELEELRFQGVSNENLRELFIELEFSQLLKGL
ncbi:MAG: 5'-3' exonuclease H3TH domain-containing protein [Candidatus Binatia bacterium]